MKSLSSWLSIMFLGLFWLFRIVVAIFAQYGGDFGGFIVFNSTVEILLIFLSLLCFVLIFKRIIWGAIIYVVGYGWYFGTYIISTFIPALTSGTGEPISMDILQNSLVVIMQLAVGLFVLINIAYERAKLKHFSDNKTDWYFGTDKYDRKMDERADKNQYRTL